MKKIKVIFFGTHDFATIILQSLINNPIFSVDLVVTQPDKPIGREREIQAPPVKILANKLGITTIQPQNLKNIQFDSKYDVGIVAQYGLIIPKEILDMPSHGIINIHTSLLPKYRGASPIQSAIINGDTKTGITIIKMNEGLDTGDILSQEEISITKDSTYKDIENKLSKIAISILPKVIQNYISGLIKLEKQNDSLATTCRQLRREDGKINWQENSTSIYNKYRALTPWPGIWTTWNDKRIKLLVIRPSENNIEAGKVLAKNDTIYIGCSSGSIEVIQLQLEGKNIVNSKTFLNGFINLNCSTLK